MLKKADLGNGHVRVSFCVSQEIWANSISLVGDFNDWDPQSLPLRQSHDDGNWSVTLDLESGRSYHFCYVVDSEAYMCDDHCDGCRLSDHGLVNSVVCT